MSGDVTDAGRKNERGNGTREQWMMDAEFRNSFFCVPTYGKGVSQLVRIPNFYHFFRALPTSTASSSVWGAEATTNWTNC